MICTVMSGNGYKTVITAIISVPLKMEVRGKLNVKHLRMAHLNIECFVVVLGMNLPGAYVLLAALITHL